MEWLDQVLADHDLPPDAFKIAFSLWRLRDRKTGEYHWGRLQLAHAAQVTQGRLKVLLTSLIERGHLEVSLPGRSLAKVYRPIIRERGH